MQQQGGSRYGVPPSEMAAPFSSGSQAGQQQPPRAVRIPPGIEYLQHQQHQAAPEAASPISSRPPPPPGSIFEEYGVGAAGGGFPDEEALGAGEEAERAGGGGNRWPRQETLALLKIRSDMDAAFRDATLKGPLWDDVSRKLAELGYARSAKKCKEKFENVHKYYKRTKEGRAGRQDGKSYRFFSQLEAIQSYTGGGGRGGQVIAALSPLPQNTASFPAVISSALVSSGFSPPQVNVSPSTLASPGSTMRTAPGLRIPPPGFSSMGAIPVEAPATATTAVAGISFSSNTSSSSASDTDGDETEEGVAGAGAMQDDGRKRKREGWQGGGSRKMMAFFDGLMKQVMERQELMQQRFFETIEKREQDRMIREEAWKRQEMARLNREYELMAQERAVAANRDAAVISFLEKFTGYPANQPPTADPTISAATPPQPSPAAVPPPPSSPQHQQQPPKPPAPAEIQLQPLAIEFDDNNSNERNKLSASSEPPSTAAAMSEAAEAMGGGGVGCLDTISPSLSSSRWPKPEVLALIKLRSGLETRYLEAGPKGPLWEEISLGMKVLGYSRNSKRCKEKWENINKYFKKVKESNKKRPEDAKTCPYFHELDALYRKKQLTSGGTAAAAAGIVTEPQPEQIKEPLRILEPISAPTEQENSNGQNKSTTGNHETGGNQIHRNNGAAGIPQVFFGGAPSRGGAAAMKKPEDIIRQLMEQQNQQRPALTGYSKLRDPADSDTINPDYDDEDEDYDDEDEEDGKLRYEIQFQRQGAGSGAAANATGKVAAAASSAGSFLAMVQ